MRIAPLNGFAAAILQRRHIVVDTLKTRRWLRGAFEDFDAVAGNRRRVLLTIAHRAVRTMGLVRKLDEHDATQREFATDLLGTCEWIGGQLRHKTQKLESYVDVSGQTAGLRKFVDLLAGANPLIPDPSSVTALLLGCFPDSRPALLVQAELLLDQGEHGEAVELIQRALRIQAVCVTAQQLLGRAYAMRRGLDGHENELDGLNYDLRDKFCHIPFTHLSTGYKGDVFACLCPAWVPYPVGNVLTAKTADEIWNSEATVEIRRSILDGDFGYCSRTLCSYIATQKLPAKADITDPLLRGYIDQRKTVLDEVPKMVELNHDPTCNLACPSCRTEIIAANADEQDLYQKAAERVILPLLRRVRGQSYISGGGEAFASKHYRSILAALNRSEYPGLYLYLITNGLLITPERWAQFPDLPEMIEILSVSIDAARGDTYERLRRPGKWPTLMKNLAFIANMRRSGEIRNFQINFVVQEDNFREILDFVELGKGLGVDSIWFQRLTSYGAFDELTFSRADVSSPRHPHHAELLEILRNPLLKQPGINLEMLMPLLPEVIASDITFPFLLESRIQTESGTASV